MSKSSQNAKAPTKAQQAAQAKLDKLSSQAVQAVATADAGKGSAMLATIITTAHGGIITADTLARDWPTLSAASRPVTVSNFMLGQRAAAIIGDAATVKLVRDVEGANPSRRYDAVLDALRAVKVQAKGLDGAATKAQIVAFVAGAAKVAAVATAEKAVAKVAAKRAAKSAKVAAKAKPTGDADLTRGMQPIVGMVSAHRQLAVWCAESAKIDNAAWKREVAKIAKCAEVLAKLAK